MILLFSVSLALLSVATLGVASLARHTRTKILAQEELDRCALQAARVWLKQDQALKTHAKRLKLARVALAAALAAGRVETAQVLRSVIVTLGKLQALERAKFPWLQARWLAGQYCPLSTLRYPLPEAAWVFPPPDTLGPSPALRPVSVSSPAGVSVRAQSFHRQPLEVLVCVLLDSPLDSNDAQPLRFQAAGIGGQSCGLTPPARLSSKR